MMTTSAECISRVEGVLEQINERLGNLEAKKLGNLKQRADKSDFALLFSITMILFSVILGLLGTVLART